MIVPCIYENVYDFNDDMALVERDGKWGYIDKSGREVIPCEYDIYAV
ncbi:MAG: WG repeat-containing protein [Armatimonadota bacterium]